MMKVRASGMIRVENEIVSNNVPGVPAHILYSEKGCETAPKRFPTMHYHDEIELIFVIKGKKRVAVNGVNYDAGEGDIIFVNAGVPHVACSTEEPTFTLLIQFNERDFIEQEEPQILSFSSKHKSISEASVGVIRSEELFSSGTAILAETRNMGTAHGVFVKAEIYKILGFLYREKYLVEPDKEKAPREVERLLPVLTFINKRYNEDVTLEEVSAISDLDPSYFCRIFKRATGASFTEYLNFVRISNAERLLTRTNRSILEISEAVGFSSVSYFNRVFKKYKSCSPRYYRSAKHGENT